MDIESRILEVINENVDTGVIIDKDTTIENAGIDSLGMFIITDALEDELKIEINLEEVEHMGSIGELVELIKQKVEKVQK